MVKPLFLQVQGIYGDKNELKIPTLVDLTKVDRIIFHPNNEAEVAYSHAIMNDKKILMSEYFFFSCDAEKRQTIVLILEEQGMLAKLSDDGASRLEAWKSKQVKKT